MSANWSACHMEAASLECIWTRGKLVRTEEGGATNKLIDEWTGWNFVDRKTILWLIPENLSPKIAFSKTLECAAHVVDLWDIVLSNCFERLQIHNFSMLHPALVNCCYHDDVIKRKHFPRHWHFVRRIHRSPVNSTYKAQWRGALTFSWSAPKQNNHKRHPIACPWGILYVCCNSNIWLTFCHCYHNVVCNIAIN